MKNLDLDQEWLRHELQHGVGLQPESAELLARWAAFCRGGRDPVAFVGAGLSANALAAPGHARQEPKAALWNDVAARLRSLLPAEERGEMDPLWLAELFEKRYTRQGVIQLLREMVPDEKLVPGEAHLALLRIRWQAILTTNYDHLIDKAHRKLTGPRDIHVSWSDERLAERPTRPDALELVHLHGRFDTGGHLTFTLEDYRQYPQRYPGMVAKVRQLFLQHPLLAVGFGASDPNFVAWSGWVGDVAGSHQPMHVNLHVSDDGRTPGTLRQGAWRDRLLFAACKPEQLATVLDLLARYLSTNGPSVDVASGVIARATNRNDVLAALFVGIRLADARRSPSAHGNAIRRLVTQAFHRLLLLAKGQTGAEPVLRSILQHDRRIGEALARAGQSIDVASLWTVEEKRAVIRETFGDGWEELLHRMLTLHRTPVLHFVDVPFLARAEPTLSERVSRYLTFLELCERASTGSDVGTVPTWLSQEQQSEIENASARAILRGAATPAAPASPATAQELRRAGYIAVMNGHWDLAADRYGQAARASRDEGEAPFAEYVSLQAARSLASVARRAADPAWTDRIARIEFDERTAVTWWDSKVEEMRADVVGYLRSAEGVSRARTTYPPQDLEVIDRAEDLWMNPAQIGRAAEVLGDKLWLEGRYSDALALLTRYGSSLAKTLIEGLKESVPPTLPPLLLARGRWPHEWRARVESVVPVIESFDLQTLSALGTWLSAAAEGLAGCEGEFIDGGHYSARSAMGVEALVDAQSARWRLLGFGVLSGEFEHWERLVDAYLREGREHPLASLPWQRWVESGQCTSADAEALLTSLLRKEESAHGLARTLIFDDLVTTERSREVLLRLADTTSCSRYLAVEIWSRFDQPRLSRFSEECFSQSNEQNMKDVVSALQSEVLIVNEEQLARLLSHAQDQLVERDAHEWEAQSTVRHASALAGSAIVRGVERDRAKKLLFECLERHPSGFSGLYIAGAARLPDPDLGRVALAKLSEHNDKRTRMNALRALARMAARSPGSLPNRWWTKVAILCGSSDAEVAADAVAVLGWSVRAPAPGGPDERSFIRDIIDTAALDARLSVRKAVAWTYANNPKEFEHLRTALEADPRSGIQAELRCATAPLPGERRSVQ